MQRRLTILGIAVVASTALLLHCGKVADEAAAGDGGSGTSGTSSGSTSNPGPTATVDAGVDDGAIASDGSVLLDASALPDVSCADDAAACDFLPPSVCADIHDVLYFGDGTCAGGSCTWTTKAMACGPQSECLNGGCTPPTTK